MSERVKDLIRPMGLEDVYLYTEKPEKASPQWYRRYKALEVDPDTGSVGPIEPEHLESVEDAAVFIGFYDKDLVRGLKSVAAALREILEAGKGTDDE